MLDVLDTLGDLLGPTLRASTPLIFAAIGGLLSERAGIVNLALEGFILIGAFAASAIALSMASPWYGLAAAMLCGLLSGLLFGSLVIHARSNQIVTGVGINMLGFGLAPLLCKLIYGSTSASPPLAIEDRFLWEPIAMALALPFVVHVWLKSTSAGLRLDFAGASPKALVAQGISLARVQWGAVLGSAVFASMGGAMLTLFLSSSFTRQISAGRGFIALAAMIIGRWRPLPTLLGCLAFGFVEALQNYLSAILGASDIPTEWIQLTPYAVALLVLAFAWRGQRV